ncbi:MAG: GAF domain-containing protein [Rhizobiales bacterium]|nr:GAF domain-containing protein [Hyphomicrobiales bacterium]
MFMTKPAIPEATLAKWQRIVNLAAEMVGVPSSLVMKTDMPDHAVLLSSRTAGNPYSVGQSFELNEKLYCYSVLQTKGELVVRDAHSDPDWCDNQDLDHGMSFYIGYPLCWPDGSLFGTVCVLDTYDNERAYRHRELVQEFGKLIENDLALLVEIERREKLEGELQDHLEQLEDRVARRTQQLSEANDDLQEREQELEEANAALGVLLSKLESSRQEFEDQILRQITGLVLPHVSKLKRKLEGQDAEQALVEIIEGNLKQVTSSFANRLAGVLQNLTPAEAEIALLVINGQTTKDIARVLSRDKSTIDFHRNNIRKKLGLRHQGVNLRSHLLSLQ